MQYRLKYYSRPTRFRLGNSICNFWRLLSCLKIYVERCTAKKNSETFGCFSSIFYFSPIQQVVDNMVHLAAGATDDKLQAVEALICEMNKASDIAGGVPQVHILGLF